VLCPQIFTCTREWPSLTSAPPTGDGAPLTTFFKEGSKIGLKCNKGALITSELGGVAQWNFALDAALGRGVNASTTFGRTAPLKIWEGKKRAKIGAIYDSFRVWAQISLEMMKIATKSKQRWWERFFLHWIKKFCEIPSTTNKVIGAHVDLP